MSKTLNEMKRDFEKDVEDEYYNGFSEKETKLNNSHNTDGGKTNFYDVNGCKDVDDLCEHWGLSFAEGNCLKALVGIAKARDGSVRHQGTSATRDGNKLVHYANRVLNTVKA